MLQRRLVDAQVGAMLNSLFAAPAERAFKRQF